MTDLNVDRPLDHPGLRRDLDRLVAAMEAAVRLGAGAVICHAFLWPGNWSVWPMRWLTRGGVIAEVDMGRLVTVYEAALERAEAYDLDVVVGNLPWGYTASTGNFRLLAERIGSPRLKFMWHPSDNLTCGEWDSATAGFRNVRPYLHSLHVKDLHVRPTDGIHRKDKDTDYRPLGEGDVDYPTILRSMRDTRSDAVLAVYGHFVPGGRRPRGRHAHQRHEHAAHGRRDRGRVAALDWPPRLQLAGSPAFLHRSTAVDLPVPLLPVVLVDPALQASEVQPSEDSRSPAEFPQRSSSFALSPAGLSQSSLYSTQRVQSSRRSRPSAVTVQTP